MDTRTLGKITIVPLFSRHGKDLAARFDRHTHPRWRQCRVSDHTGDFLELRPGPWEIAGYLNVELLRLTALCVDEIDITGLLINNCIGPRRCRHDVKIVILLLTDNDLALIRIKQQKKGNPIYGTPVRAQGTIGGENIFGVPVRSACDAVELRKALEAAFAADGPVIVEAVVDSREYDDVVLKKDKP